jgi:hypothetical protein
VGEHVTGATRGLIVAVCACLTVAGCTHSTTEPTTTDTVSVVALVCSQDSVTIARNTSTRLFVRSRLADSGGEDVTAAATWTSSNSQVVTVASGLVSAVGVGAATITVSYAGLTRTIAVTARRNTLLVGTVTMAGTGTGRAYSWGWFTASSRVMLDNLTLELASATYTSTTRVFQFGTTSKIDTNVDPGAHELTITACCYFVCNAFQPVSSADSFVEIRDRDTGETLGRTTLSQQTLNLTADTASRVTWTIDVGVFQ